MYFNVQKPTPLLNTPHFSEVYGKALPFDDKLLVREVEMIALPSMSLEVIQKWGDNILEVKTREYPSSKPLYIDSRFGVLSKAASPIEKKMPPENEILEKMYSMIGLPYVWGGNYSAGIPEWITYYPPQKPLSSFEKVHWTFHGIDCSGLIYEATNGCTPRNTKELLSYGIEVTLDEIQPLDLIHYPGHVIVALNEKEVIESRHEYGNVRITPLEKRLADIEGPFTVRRFHPIFFQTP